jgi:hypothetical protein
MQLRTNKMVLRKAVVGPTEKDVEKAYNAQCNTG